jgi:hypothetical protein
MGTIAHWVTTHFPVALVEYPQLYCYRVTGENTWKGKHFDQLFDQATRTFKKEEFGEVFKLPCFDDL